MEEEIFYNRYNENYQLKIHKDKDNSIIIASFNVHGWVNLNKKIDVKTNIENIVSLFAPMDIDVLVLQEVCLDTINTFNELKKRFNFPYAISAENGGCFLREKGTDYIVVFSKKNITNYEIVNLSFGKYIRNIIRFEIDNNIKIAALHLEIGERFHHLPNGDIRNNIIKNNTNVRIKQLKHLYENMDILIGDFNFTFQDKEFIWLKEKGLSYYSLNFDDTNPYNRCDMIFLSNRVTSLWDIILHTNYSDHLPIIAEISY